MQEHVIHVPNLVSVCSVSYLVLAAAAAAASAGSAASSRKGAPPQLLFNVRTPLNNGHGVKLHEDTVWAGVECLAVFILDCGLHLPPAQASSLYCYGIHSS